MCKCVSIGQAQLFVFYFDSTWIPPRFWTGSLRETAYLVLLYGRVVLVAHGADLHAFVPLPVALREELHHDAVRPLPVQLQRLGGVAQVRTVHHVLQHLAGPMNHR